MGEAKSERATEAEIRKHQPFNEYHFEYHSSDEERINSLLATSSKRCTGKMGHPDIIAYSADISVLLLCEVKGKKANHCNHKDYHPHHREIQQVDRYACSGVRHYLKAVLGELERCVDMDFRLKIRFVIGIAASGRANNMCFTTYACNIQQSGFQYVPRFIADDLAPLDEIAQISSSMASICAPRVPCTPLPERFVTIASSGLLNALRFTESEFQRVLQPRHVEEIREYYLARLKKRSQPASTGILIGELEHQLYIIDGQHRLQAYKDLLLHERIDIDVPVSVVRYSSYQEMQDDFIVHNQHVGLTSAEREHAAAPSDESKRSLLSAEEILEELMKRFPGAILPKKKYLGRMSMAKVRQRLQEAVRDRETPTGGKNAVIEHLLTKEAAFKTEYEALDGEKRTPSLQRLAASCEKVGCWLGYDGKMARWFT